MPITPDTKNWTWVTERRCLECGFDASTFPLAELSTRLRANAAAWPAVLAGPDARLRPDDHTWSPLEYGAHVRDVHRVYGERLQRYLHEENPEFRDWNQDEAAIAGRYSEQDPSVVAAELVAAAGEVASGFERVPDDAWNRPASRSDGVRFTLESFARYYLHDVVHHLWDVRPRG